MSKSDKKTGLIEKLAEERKLNGNVLDFDFKKKRVNILSKVQEVPENGKAILYWMFRDKRVQDNWAFLFAQKLALKNKLPLHILYVIPPVYLEYTLRHYNFLFKGLKEVEKECKNLKIKFDVKVSAKPTKEVLDYINKNEISGVVCDFLPLRDLRAWQDEVLNGVPKNVPFVRVDAHNIVPCLIVSDKLEYAARTIRNKINDKLSIYLTPFPEVIEHPYHDKKESSSIKWDELLKQTKGDSSVDEVDWAKPGYTNGIEMLASFCDSRLKNFAGQRNDPTKNALSNLSPWLNYGFISAQRCVLTVRDYKSKFTDSVNSYCEEVIIRRELSDNFCYYNEHYDSIKGAPSWAQTTLNEHKKDKRDYCYSLEELEQSLTHEDLWNSAQIELVKRGKLHGFMRMYWAKKILEWTESPETALKYAFKFNDKYALDGNDSNGYVGVMWSICGIHDQGWAERKVFGKIRYMNYAGCKRKFDINAYVIRWGGVEHSAGNKKISEIFKKKTGESSQKSKTTKKEKDDDDGPKKKKTKT